MNGHSHRAADLPDVAEHLRRTSRKVTTRRRGVLKALAQFRHPVTIKQVFERVGRTNCDLATVYRSMHLLEELGLVKRYDFGDGSARYEALRQGEEGHHHHLVCTRCAQVVELAGCGMGELEGKIAASNGFSGVTHKLEFFGLCPHCRAR